MIGLVDLVAAPVRAIDRGARWWVGRAVPAPSGLAPYCQADQAGEPTCDNPPSTTGRTRTGRRIDVCAEHDGLLVR